MLTRNSSFIVRGARIYFPYETITDTIRHLVPPCGDLSNTPDFHVDQMAEDKQKDSAVWILIAKILILLSLSGGGWVLLQSLLGG